MPEQQKVKPIQVQDLVAFSTLDSYTVVNLQDIVCCLAEKGYTRLYFQDREGLLISKGLGQLEEFLPKAHFIRVHKNAMVSLRHVQKVLKGENKGLLLSNGMEVAIADRRRRDLLGRLLIF
ncbi:MAG: hypothetical protein GC192_16620 [Bacteroidetes bacterium]|nr:hypothetical protein [Bacteroidota bacterium]